MKLKRAAPAIIRPHRVMKPLVWRATGGEVQSGPFRGMKYVRGAVGGSHLPKLVGCYEKEIVAAIDAIQRLEPACLIDIGAAEGYYAVGMAMLMPRCRVISYERNETGRQLHAELAELNGVADRNDIRGDCGAPQIREALAECDGTPVIICDVEAYEEVLLDPAEVPALTGAAILVEVHENLRPGLRQLLRDRFAATHEITVHEVQPRSKSDYPFRAWWQTWLPRRYATHPLAEFRQGETPWYWMTPKAAGGS